ncbi:MAG: 23S rRNA (guanosine(2251)-2'-O)-methyltransferase RlmB [Thermodesulfobacteriota bacterium]|nr:23S rRNA (guanosine(2251)-2'-O)-methyltransferase RlmB [Thermodesulfobacteriota bacterium]
MGSENENANHFIPGFQAVREALLKSRENIEELWIAEGKRSDRAKEILRLAGQRGVPVQFKKGTTLDDLLPDITHQGMVALARGYSYTDFNHIIDISQQGPGHALIIAADHITDEGNLGALIRTAAFFGAHGLILPKNRSARVTGRVRKRSSGGYIHLPVARVVNLGRALDTLNLKGFWIIGATAGGPESIYGFDWMRDLILVLGSEDRGLSRTVRTRCHELVNIPACGHLDSLNISVASGIILSEIVRQRGLMMNKEKWK